MTEAKGMIAFNVGRNDLRHHKIDAAPLPELQDGDVLLKVDRFAFTSNNVTYAAFGEAMHYWDFFPAPEGYGNIPVWGFADVAASRSAEVRPGERVFGYLPMASHFVVRPAGVKAAGFIDASAHRSHLAPVYNQYTRVANDPGYVKDHEDQQALLRPLFMTSFFIDDLLADRGFFGAKSVILSSASSKTALGTAFLLTRNRDVEVIGLTSAGNVGFVERTGYYTRVVPYDRIASLPAGVPTAFVDMAGNASVVSDIHHHFKGALLHSMVVGGTHWEAGAGGGDLPGPKREFFFAPTQIQKRTKDWGPGGIETRFAEAWRAFIGSTAGWMRVIHGKGAPAVEAVYLDMLDGRVPPEEGHILSF